MITKVTAIIQARMTSTRLPGKVLKQVLGKPLLSYLVERLSRVQRIDQIMVATTKNRTDDPIERLVTNLSIPVFRGSEANVLDRFYQAAKTVQAEHILRITADCPLIDPVLIDELIEFYHREKFDYASNCDPPSLPDGLDAEVFSFDVLAKAHANAKLPSEREHVTPYIRNHPDKFKIGNLAYSPDLSHLRWTVDEPDDFILVRELIESIYPLKSDFNMGDVLAQLQKSPSLCQINAHIQRNEGAIKSLIADQAYILKHDRV